MRLDETEKATLKIVSITVGVIAALTFVGQFLSWVIAYFVLYGSVILSIMVGTVAGRRIYKRTKIQIVAWAIGIAVGVTTGIAFVQCCSLSESIDEKIEVIHAYAQDF